MSAIFQTRRDGVLYSPEWERCADLIELAAHTLAMTPDDVARLHAIVADAIQIEDNAGATAAIAFLEGRWREWLAEKGVGAA